jgi:hypothetical protein
MIWSPLWFFTLSWGALDGHNPVGNTFLIDATNVFDIDATNTFLIN